MRAKGRGWAVVVVALGVRRRRVARGRADGTRPNDQIWHCDPKTLFHVTGSG